MIFSDPQNHIFGINWTKTDTHIRKLMYKVQEEREEVPRGSLRDWILTITVIINIVGSFVYAYRTW